ncbi:WW domain-containing protein [Rhynchospora pubera]|uniref:WW domain-containing protein n=1 Tax=Rhynchospora pubera TaxID=906938 RepID=A0AAV8HLV2_9POAL|nr:WW domain-containing protein [Rhynchospora pubera]
MGKRKERRLAAMAASRRFKLDLFADPSGDSSIQEGARDNLDHGGETGDPDSPTSGKKENPLSLLSQYTDEDSDEDDINRSSDANREGSVPNGQITENTVESGKVGNCVQEIASATFEDFKNSTDLIEKVFKEVEVTETENLATEDQSIQRSSTEPVVQEVSDVGGDWKAVMHAETNQCYYWNTVTGETSWEVPASLVLTVPNEVVASDKAPSIEASKEVSELVEMAVSPLDCQLSGLEDNGLPAKCNVAATEEDKGMSLSTAFAEDFDPDKLVKYGEDLLERLKLLDGSSIQIEKIKEEIEIRMSDCKELKPYGVSLFPFWLHTQSKLSCLEASIYNAEVSLSKTTPDSREDESVKETYTATFENPNKMPEYGREGKEREEQKENGGEQDEKEKEKEEIREEETILPIEDVDMEVEEEDFGTDVANPNIETPLSSLEEGEVPPPPSPPPDEWAPPPPPPPEDEPAPLPPEDESVPPPPPEEPSISYSVVEAIPPYQNYISVPTYNYSAPIGGYTQPNYYGTYYAVPAQVSAPVSSMVTQAVAVTNGMVEQSVYSYTVPAAQSAVEISSKPECNLPGYHSASFVSTTNETLVSSASQAVGSVYGAGDASVVSSSAAASSVTVSSAAVSVAASSAAAIYASASSAATSSSVAPLAVSKDQIKVAKSKKRSMAVASTLSSNKRVASLVNKWKAAKEELDGDYEDEPESAYEALERKRQREIEEWRQHQIASGEAQDNANFVPLGGDWRERVKKKRATKAAKMKDAPETSSNVAAVTEYKKQGQEESDLGQLSVGLPPGWQAYWDESSKQVYYGNASTSETTWVRPT